MIRFAGVLLAGALLIAAAEPVWDWGDTNDSWNGGFATSKAICRAVRGREPPPGDRPDAAAAAALKGCDSEALFYGIGMAADPVKARQCAFVEAPAAAADEMGAPFTGTAMLMTIYANGVGAARDLDVATHLACRVDGAPAESDGRVLHLRKLKAEGWKGRDFHFCDDITSGLAMGWCAGHDARITAAKREARIAALTRGWKPAERAAFARLRAAEERYAEAHSGGEIDATGTMRGVFWTGAREKRAEELLGLVEQLAAARSVPPGVGGFAGADRALNTAYRARLAALRRETSGTVTAEGVRGAQRAWLGYRDAFLAFAVVKYPKTGRDSLAAHLTRLRIVTLSGEEGADDE
ncbi:MAG TPA: lysozyme inhibitor LprI family protein [Allosphingosinicella sp.]